MNGAGPVVIVGAGHGGFTVAEALRQLGYRGGITLIDAEDALPYQRPPLSKAHLAGDLDGALVPFRAAEYYAHHDIDYVRGDRCVSIDRDRACVVTAGGSEYPFAHLVLATGAAAVALQVPGAGLDGVRRLRTWADSTHLGGGLVNGSKVVVIGGGFIGLEAAAVALKRGAEVTVVEAMPRLMSRAVSEAVSQHFLRGHRAAGATVMQGARVCSVRGHDGRVRAVELEDRGLVTADIVVVGVGVRPRTELAAAAGLLVGDGIVVDQYLRTSDPRISAIGDCCSFPNPVTGNAIRLESVQNATDQARCVAARLIGDAQPYRDTPWFWSDQGGQKVQTVGLAIDVADQVVHGNPDDGRFSVLHLDNAGRVVCGESVNSPADHVALRTLVTYRERIAPVLRNQADVSLKTLAKAARIRRKPLAS